jgi:hypothetical protein
MDFSRITGSEQAAPELLHEWQKLNARSASKISDLRVLAVKTISYFVWPTVELWPLRFPLYGCLPFAMALLAGVSSVNARASDSAEILLMAPPALAFARYIALLNQRSPFDESGPVAVDIAGSLPRLGKRACRSAIRWTGASERSEYQVLHIEGDPMVKLEVIARYLSVQAQAEALPLSSALISPANYKFHYFGSTRTMGTFLYGFQIRPRKKRVGLIEGLLWIDAATGIAVHQAGHFAKMPSVLIRRIDITRDTSLHDGFSYIRITHAVVYTRLPVGRAELTIVEGPLTASKGEVTSQLAGERSRP